MSKPTKEDREALRAHSAEEAARLEYMAVATVAGLSEKGEQALAHARTTLAVLTALDEAEADVGRMRLAMAELRDLQGAVIRYISETGACEMALDDEGTCDGAGCDYCQLARVEQRVGDSLAALDRVRGGG